MNVELVSVYEYRGAKTLLWLLLDEREEFESISHKAMPTWEEHSDFVDSGPYERWWIIVNHREPVGAMYVTEKDEVGIGIFMVHRRQGFAKAALEQVVSMWPRPLHANINPENEKSIEMFQSLGFTHCQLTLKGGV